ncbi:MAG: hypothetical protein J4G05_06185 [Chlorobi bacterium]|nr:hypothetical protein [Chlorobiota bacterium]
MEYSLSEQPGTSPLLEHDVLKYPIVIKPGETRTFSINFLPIRSGSRYARLFLRSNGENFTGTDAGRFNEGNNAPVEVEGILTIIEISVLFLRC